MLSLIMNPQTAQQINAPQVGELELAPVLKTENVYALAAQKTIASDNPALAMMQAMIDKGVTSDNAAAFESVVKLCEHMEDRAAERAFNAAFVTMKKELPQIPATKVVPLKNGGIKYKYAPYEEIAKIADPILQKHGFTTRFSTRPGENTQTCICTLLHEKGHSVANEFTVRVGSGPHDSTAAQADTAAATSAQREAFCDAIGIVRRPDDDARKLGATISKVEADALRRRVQETGSDEGAFLKFAGAGSYEEIQSSKLPTLDAMLKRKEDTR